MAEIVEVVKKKAPVESVTVKLTRAEALELVSALDAAHRGHRYFFDIHGGRSKVGVKLEDAVNGTVTIPIAKKYQESVESLLRDAYSARGVF